MGLAVARHITNGRHLVLADYSAAHLDTAVTNLGDEGYAVEGQLVDVSDRSSVEKLASAAAHIGRIDAVVHTAGVSPVMASARQIYEVDLVGTAHVIDAFFEVASPGTSLVCIASMAGHFASLPAELERHLATAPTEELLRHDGIDLDSDPQASYVVAKRGNQLRVSASAQAWGRKGARLNTISPGVISTPMGLDELRGPTGDYIQEMVKLSAAGRLGTPGDIAGVAEFLAGQTSSFITGNDILVDGGTVSALHWSTAGTA
ncbi:SDR family oxidoreductase [Frankia sp. AgB1.9]|nr:SDR family oxidoreductase [Frankia sp. AgW1.1]MBL7554097.1 SDR family oxidoreductase [Frankia sp. AgB1.9]MBL7618395.1 SDR family oxidoreductase [Frankia sp. AgB1.8]